MIDENTKIGATSSGDIQPNHLFEPYRFNLLRHEHVVAERDALKAEVDKVREEITELKSILDESDIVGKSMMNLLAEKNNENSDLLTRYDALKVAATRAINRWTDGDTGGIADLAQTLTEVEGECKMRMRMVDKIYKRMNSAQRDFDKLRSGCSHPSYYVGWYSWRVGNREPRRLCTECDATIEGITEAEAHKFYKENEVVKESQGG